MAIPQTIMPAQPVGSGVHIPEFITNVPDPKTGQSMPDTDQDVHGTLFPVVDRYVASADVTQTGDVGRKE